MAYLLILLAIVFWMAWLVSEYQQRRWLRITMGLCCIASFLMIAIAVGLLQQLNYNAWYGVASAELIDTTVKQIEAGHSAALLTNLRQLREEFRPTYENRAHYDELVKRFVNRASHEQSE
jgi:hypothetical protein